MTLLESDEEQGQHPAASTGRTLLVASTGGHLEELHRLSRRLLPAVAVRDWVTFDDPQSRSLLGGERAMFVRYVPPRGYREALGQLQAARRILRDGDYARVISTGAGIAVPFLLAARMRGLEAHFIESAARAEGPSLSGRLVSRVPGVHLYTQYPQWAGARWSYHGSLFDGYRPSSLPIARQPEPARKVVVTLGTMRTYGFRRAVERLLRVLPDVVAPQAEILWQVGATDVRGLPVQARDRVPTEVLRQAVAEADLVVAHAGIGSALTALDAGRCPVLLPRLHRFDEHVDDHQTMIADSLSQRRLVVAADASKLSATHLRAAMSRRIDSDVEATPFRLDGGLTQRG